MLSYNMKARGVSKKYSYLIANTGIRNVLNVRLELLDPGGRERIFFHFSNLKFN